MRPQVKVAPSDIKPGDIYRGYDSMCDGHVVNHFCVIEVGEDNVPRAWGRLLTEEVICFKRDMTWEEEREWTRQQTMELTPRDQMNLIGIHTDLYGIADARHEMWNGWIETSWEEQIMRLRNEDFYIVGIVDPAPPRMGLPMRHPVAVVIEYEDGDRYWCHAEKDWFDDMREESLERYRQLGG